MPQEMAVGFSDLDRSAIRTFFPKSRDGGLFILAIWPALAAVPVPAWRARPKDNAGAKASGSSLLESDLEVF